MTDFSQQHHDMFLDKTHPSGAEEWFCSACGRRFVMQWPPKYKRIVLYAGDEQAGHGGSKGGLQMTASQITNGSQGEGVEDNLRLDHWQSWLESEDANKWWPDDQ